MVLKDINCSFGQQPSQVLHMSAMADIVPALEKNSITSYVFSNNFSIKSDIVQCNSHLLEECRKYPDAIPAITLLPPVFGNEFYSKNELLDMISKAGEVAFRMYPKRHGYIFADWQLSWLGEMLNETGIPVIIDIDDLEIRDLVEVKRRYENLCVIIVKTAQWMNRVYVQLCRSFKNVYIDTSNIIEYMGIEEFCKEIGSEKILFGTNTPLKEPYDNILTLLYANISQTEKENIAFRNFDRLLKRRV